MSKDSSAKYYQKYKKGYKKRLVKVSKIFPEKKKKIKQDYRWKRHKNLPEAEKQSFFVYRKNYFKSYYFKFF